MIDKKSILVEISNRHVHFSKNDLEFLFGKGYKLNPIKQLSQPGEFAAQEKVDIIHGDKKLEGVRILGPEREKTQIELSKSDAIKLDIDIPLRMSGDIENTPGLKIAGPMGILDLKQGTIISQRHLHASDEEAEELGIKHGHQVSMKISSKKEFILNNIFVRAGMNHRLALHLDKDEGDSIFIDKRTYGELI